jgi:hypothetical protein
MTSALEMPKRNLKAAAEWRRALAQVAADVERWALEENWSFHRESKKFNEKLTGPYVAPVLKVKSALGEIWLEPVARDIVGAEGRINITSWPAHNQAAMIRVAGKWKFILDNDAKLRKAWSKELVKQLMSDLSR